VTLTDQVEKKWLIVPSKLRRQGEALMQQQCWCWGCDVRSESNALLQHGLVRTRPPAEVKGSSMYSLPANHMFPGGGENESGGKGRRAALWGFGVFYGDADAANEFGEGGVFIGRFSFAPRYITSSALPEGVWKREQLSHFRAPQTEHECDNCLRLWRSALHWIAEYEEWRLHHYGVAGRLTDLRGWNHKFVQPEMVPAALRQLGDTLPEKCHRRSPR
jgi:hypothetical protein